MISSTDEMSGEEIFSNALFRFLNDLNILSLTVAEQCAKYQYYNVAWELRNDLVGDATELLNFRQIGLSVKQVKRILIFREMVEQIPKRITDVKNEKDQHLRAMSDPIWIPIRVRAAEIVNELPKSNL